MHVDLVRTTLHSTPLLVTAAMESNSPMHQHSRYVDIRGVGMNVILLFPEAKIVLLASGMFERASVS